MLKRAKISRMGLLTAAMLLGGMGMGVAQAQVILEASQTMAVAGETGHEITVEYTNVGNGEIVGYQFELPVPQGYFSNLSVAVSDPEIDPICALRNGNEIFCMAMGYIIADLPPHVLTISIDVDSNTPNGVIPLIFQGVQLVDMDFNDLPANPDDLINGSITITPPPVCSSTPAPGSTLDESAASGDAVQFSVAISNSGDGYLNYDCSVSGTGFNITSGASGSNMAANASSTVVVSTVAPAAGNTISGTLSCNHNGPASASPALYTLNVSAPLPPPVYSSNPAPGSTLSETAPSGDAVQFSVAISNSGGDGLDYTCSVSGTGFSITSGASANNMAAGDSSTVVVSAVSPAAGNTISGTLSCTHNDLAGASPAQYTLNLSAPLPPPVYSSNPAPGSTLSESAAQGSPVQFSVAINNSGGDGLDYTCNVSGTGFSIASGGSNSNMAANASSTVVVDAVAPAGGNTITGTLSCTHNGPASTSPAQYTLSISAPALPTNVFCNGFEEDDEGCPESEIVFVDDVDLVFAQTGAGSSINWLTGDICNCDAGNYHFNIWLRSGEMAFYFPIRVAGENGVVADAEGVVRVLQSGDTIGPDATYNLGSSSTYGSMAAAWRQASGVHGYIGFRFLNTDTGEVNYGYAEMTTTGTTGYPVTIHRYWFNAAGNPITIP